MKTCMCAVLAIAAAGCNAPRPPEPSAEKKTPPAYYQVDPAEAASVKGRVHFSGKRPPARRISMDSEAECAALHKTPVLEELVDVGKQGGLANVFVYVKSGLEGKKFAPPQTAVVLDQHGCQFVPRVIALQAGQTLDVKNSDPVSHNIHPQPRNNRDWNQQQSPGSPDLQRRFARTEVMIPVKCNVHSWMRSYIGVVEHPFLAVTGRGGVFTLEGLPPGEYTIGAWHETLGELTEKVVLGKAGTAEVNFEFK